MEENQIKKALLVIDLQQDFTSPNGPFKQSYVKADHIISNLSIVLPDFRDQNGTVIWVKSDYSKLDPEPKYLTRPEGKQFEDIPLNSAYLSGTHKSFPLCIPGTDGEQFMPEVHSLLKEDQDVIIYKTYYSAFTDTNLADTLKDVKEVHICGLVTNVCVRATATDAFFHGYKVYVWTDCLGYRKEREHHASLEIMEQLYATMITSTKSLKQPQIDTPKPVLYFVNGSIPSWRVMMALYEKNIHFEGKRLRVMSKPKETKSAEFLAINPRGLTPTFVDTDGSIIAESLAILHYLEHYYPHTLSLLPTEKANRINVLQRIQESQNLVDIYEPLEEVVFKTPKEEQSSHKDSIIKAFELIDQELTFWEMYSTKTTFIACNEFTLADCAFYPVVAYLIHRGLNIDKFPALLTYVNKIKTKSAAVNSHPQGWKWNGGKVDVFKVAKDIVAGCNKENE